MTDTSDRTPREIAQAFLGTLDEQTDEPWDARRAPELMVFALGAIAGALLYLADSAAAAGAEDEKARATFGMHPDPRRTTLLCNDGGCTFTTDWPPALAQHRRLKHPAPAPPVAVEERRPEPGELVLACAEDGCGWWTELHHAFELNRHARAVHRRPATQAERTPRIVS